MAGFILRRYSWGLISNEISLTSLAKIAETGVSGDVTVTFTTMRFSVSVGWSIYCYIDWTSIVPLQMIEL